MSSIFRRQVDLKETPDKTFRFCASPQGFESIFPYPIRWRSDSQAEWGLHSVLDFKYRVLFFWIHHRAVIDVWEPPTLFVDTMLGKSMLRFRHFHRFEPIPGGTRVIDEIEIKFGGKPLERAVVKPMLGHVFKKRHQNLASMMGTPPDKGDSDADEA